LLTSDSPLLRGVACLAAICLTLTTAGLAEETLPIENPPAEKTIAEGVDIVWTPTDYAGVETFSLRLTEPYPIAFSAVRLDLKTALRFFVTPQNGDAPEDTNSETAGTFMRRHGCQVVINGSPYGPVVSSEGIPQNVLGISASNGDLYSKEKVDYDAVFISPDNEVRFGKRPPEGMTVHNALSGFNMVLVDGKNVGAGGARHPRSSIGLSKDKRYLYLAVRDGRQPEYSIGATLAELGDWMQRLGADTALNLDGGGSSALLLADKDGDPIVLNRPCNLGLPGVQRPNANHLGVFVGK